MKESNKIVLLNSLSTIILQSLTFFTAPIISRMLGADNYGVASVYVTWVTLASMVFGIQTQSTLAIAKQEFSENEQTKYQSSVLALSSILYLFFSVVVMLLLSVVTSITGFDNNMIVLLLFQGFGQMCVNFFNTKFTYEFKAGRNFVLTVLLSVFTLGLSVILIDYFPQSNNYMGRIWGMTIPYFGIGIVLCSALLVKGRTLFNHRYWKFCIPLCLPIVVHNVCGLALNQSNKIVIRELLDNNTTGIYSLAYSFASVLSSIWVALNNSWVPYYYEYTRENRIEELKKRALRYLELFSVLTIGFVFLSREVYYIFAGKEYWPGTKLIPIFAVGFYMTFLYSFPVNYEFYHKKTKLIALGTVMSAMLNIFLNIILLQWFGVIGASLATAIALGAQFIFHTICSCKIIRSETGYPFSLKMLLPFMCIIFLCVVGYYMLEERIILRWLLAIMIGFWEIYRIVKRKEIF